MLPHKAGRITSNPLPIQGYIQLRPQAVGSLPAFGATRQSTSGCTCDTDAVEQHAPRRIGKASPSLLAILSARTLADTADVDRVMSELSMMIIRAMIVSNDFCTPKECLVPHGSPH